MEDWLQATRVQSRDPELRRKLRHDAELHTKLQSIFIDTESTEDVLILGVSILGNVVIGDEHYEALEEMINHGVLEAFFQLCIRCVDQPDSAKLNMVCTIAIANIVSQLQMDADLFLGSSLVIVCVLFACRGSTVGIQTNALDCLVDISESSLVQLFKYPAITEFVPPLCIGLHSHTTAALNVVQFFISQSSGIIENENLKFLIDQGVVAGILDCFDGDMQVSVLAATIVYELSRIGVGEQGQFLRDADFFERCKLLHEAGVVLKCLDVIKIRDLNDFHLLAIQSLACIIDGINEISDEIIVLLWDRAGAVVCFETDVMEPLVKKMRIETHNQLQDCLRKQILPHASYRLNGLRILNTLGARKEFIELNVAEEDLLKLCFRISLVSFDFDIEATRYAINILRNYCIDARTHIGFLGMFDTYHVGDGLGNIARISKDSNSAASSAAILRLLCSSLNDVSNLLSDKELQQLVHVDVTKISPYARVEIARVLCCCTIKITSNETLKCDATLSAICFLLLSDQDILHREVLHALCSFDLLPSKIQLHSKVESFDLKSKLEMICKIDALSELASKALSKIDTTSF